MKYSNIVKSALVIAATSGLALSSSNALAASASANATATVMQSIAITKNADLAFGAFSPSTGGTVVMGTNNSRSGTGAVVLSSSDAGNRAQFTVTGTSGATYAITLPSNGTVTIASGGNTMAVNSFTSNPSGTGTLTGGTEVVYVGGTLTVGNAQASGSYTGTFNVSVEYN